MKRARSENELSQKTKMQRPEAAFEELERILNEATAGLDRQREAVRRAAAALETERERQREAARIVHEETTHPTPAANDETAIAKMQTDDDAKLWNLTSEFCKHWDILEKHTDALGVRNVLAAFYFLFKLVNNEDNHGLDFFPESEDWFKYTGRFLGLYVKDVVPDTPDRVHLTDHTNDMLDTPLLKDVKVEMLKEEDGAAAWADNINNDCNTATNGKITQVVTEDALNDKNLALVVMAAEFIKGYWVYDFASTTTNYPFFGAGDAPLGRCHMMHHKISNLGGGELFYDGQHCKAVLMPTKRKEDDRNRTSIYGLVVLPNGEPDKPTPLDAMNRANDEIGENLAELKKIVDDGDKTPMVLEMPRIEHKMNAFDLTKTCRDVFGAALTKVDGITEIETPGGTELAPLEVGRVMHSTFLKVNETGFEAAAATTIEVMYRSLDLPPTIMTVNRGFLFYLVEMGEQPHVLYYCRITDDTGLKDAEAAPGATENPYRG
ncbi:MAG: serpin family protein [Alphaproteobacteria bacterium]